MTTPTESQSLPELLSTLVTQMSTLFRQEIRLARTETSENITRMTNGGMMLAVAAVVILPGLVLFLEAIAAMLVAGGMEPRWSLLVVSVVTLAVGAILVFVGLGRLNAASLMPDRTIEQVRRDASTVKEQVR